MSKRNWKKILNTKPAMNFFLSTMQKPKRLHLVSGALKRRYILSDFHFIVDEKVKIPVPYPNFFGDASFSKENSLHGI